MIAISVRAAPAAPVVSPLPIQSAKSALLKPVLRSPFSTLLNNRSPDEAPAKQRRGTNDLPLPIAFAALCPPKVLIPIAFTRPGQHAQTSCESSDSAAGDKTDPTLETVELQQPIEGSTPQTEELAFEAKLVGTTARAQIAPQQRLPVTPAIATEPTPSRSPLPTRVVATPQARPDAEHAELSDAPEHRFSEQPAVAQLESSSQTPRPASPQRGIETTPLAHNFDYGAPPLDRAPTSPLNEITVRIANPDQTSASVRMAEHTGELRVAVRASDPQVADALRGNIDQLTSRLNSNGWSAEVWKPVTDGSLVKTQSASQELFQGQQGSGDRQREHSPSDRHNNNNKQKYLDWVEEFLCK